MGQGKLRVELIRNEKLRKFTFKKRKEGLIKKLHELTTLCDVSACMIISEAAPANNLQGQPVDIWPPNPEKVRQIVESYKAKTKDDSSTSCTKFGAIGLSDFFRDRQKRIEEELAKLRRRNMEAKYPICHEILNTLTEAQLREFGAALENKAQIAKSRIEFLKMMSTKQLESSVDFAAKKNWNLDDQETASASSSYVNHHYQNSNNSHMMMMDSAPERLSINNDLPHGNWNIINDYQQEITDTSSSNQQQDYMMMMMVMMNENDVNNFNQNYYGMNPQYYMAAPVVEAAVLPPPPQLQCWNN